MEQRREELRPAGLTLQPIPYFVGDLPKITGAGFIINATTYSEQSAFEAIDSCFQSFHALDSAYPERASTLWLFVQNIIYNITDRGDKINRSLNALIGEIQGAVMHV